VFFLVKEFNIVFYSYCSRLCSGAFCCFRGVNSFMQICAYFCVMLCLEPIAVAERSKARTVFARTNTAIVGSNHTEAWMFVCVLCAFFLFLHSLK
jgi:hypothetical protein